jgi:hypothetical protein
MEGVLSTARSSGVGKSRLLGPIFANDLGHLLTRSIILSVVGISVEKEILLRFVIIYAVRIAC